MLRVRDVRRLVLLLGAAGVAPMLGAPTLAAQETPPIGAGEWVFGQSLGLPGRGREAYPPALTMGVHFLRLPTEWPFGAEVSVGTAPVGFFSGVLPVGVRAVVNLPLRPWANHVFLPSAGVGLVGVVSRNGVGGIAGVNLGVAYAVFGGMRIGVTWNHVTEWPHDVWLLEVGFLSLPGS